MLNCAAIMGRLTSITILFQSDNQAVAIGTSRGDAVPRDIMTLHFVRQEIKPNAIIGESYCFF